MSEVLTLEELAEIQVADLTWEKLEALKERVVEDVASRRVVASFAAELAERAPKLRNVEKVHDTCFLLGAMQWVLSRFGQAAKALAEVKRSDFARELEAESRLAAGDYAEALKLYIRLAEKFPCVKFDMGRTACLRGLGDMKEADTLLESFKKKYVEEAEFQYQLGMKTDLVGSYEEAAACYEKALELDEDHAPSLFRLAFLSDLRGDEEEALRLYERCASLKPVHVNAVLNLGVLYEDLGRYEDAAKCYRRVLAWNPNHERARLFLADAQASLTMYYDEDMERKVDRQNKVLEIPVTDFELSVRSRNCLERMNVKTLGDLTQVSEPELLGYKNFGETSLSEIKNMMASKGLRLGQGLEKEPPRSQATPSDGEVETEEGGLASKPVGELELSVRSRKCMQRLGIATIGQLCDRTEEQLMSSKNFGQTSLNEIRQKLANLGLKLKESK